MLNFVQLNFKKKIPIMSSDDISEYLDVFDSYLHFEACV